MAIVHDEGEILKHNHVGIDVSAKTFTTIIDHEGVRSAANGSRISGEPLLKSLAESTTVGARRHEPPYPELEGRRIEGGGVGDGLVQGSSVCIRLLCGGLSKRQPHDPAPV